MNEIKKVVLAYSGGLDTSIMIAWLKENYGCEVICVCADLGQGQEIEGLKEKALSTGASKIYIEDLTQEFVKDFIFPTIKAGAVYEKKYLLGTSFARPVIAKKLVEIALKENADAIAHGATGKGNDQVRFELTIKALCPQIKIIAPWRDPKWTIKSRQQSIDYAQERNIPIPVKKDNAYSMDRNIWHLSHEGMDLEDPWNEPNENMFLINRPLSKASDKPEYVEVDFIEGNPVGVNGKTLDPVKLLETLNEIGAAHCIGISDIVENRLVGMKSRGVYENPGGAILYYAHNELEYLTLDRALYHYKEVIALRYAELVYDGMWYSPLRKALDAFVNETQKTVTGKVRMKLFKGNIISAGSQSPYSIYDKDLVTFEEGGDYNQADATGFINIFGLPLKVDALRKQKNKKK
ncbi:MAG: argininosuccinate synthase [Elusimicrobiota bacterium]|jgi:argininosuccinate synthase|nr:argininosuccinate synthase [Elusimicrobiota bacterium]